MKNFYELLDTELSLVVTVNGKSSTVGLHDHLVFAGDASVSIDGIEVLPKFWHLVQNGELVIDEPFYCWYHRATNQGWLLSPH